MYTVVTIVGLGAMAVLGSALSPRAVLRADPVLFILEAYSNTELIRRDQDGSRTTLPLVFNLANRVRIVDETLMIVDSGSDELILVDLDQALNWQQSGDPLSTRRLTTSQSVGANAWDVLSTENGEVAVSNLVAGSVSLLSPAGLETEIPLAGATPQGMLLQENRLLVADSGFGTGTSLWSIDLMDHSTSVTLTLENPQEIVQTGNRLDVLCSGNWTDGAGQIHGLDATTLAPLDTLVLGNHPGSIASDGSRYVYTGDTWAFPSGVYRYDAVDRVITHGNATIFGSGGNFSLVHGGEIFSSGYATIYHYLPDATVIQEISAADAIVHFCAYSPRPDPELTVGLNGANVMLSWTDTGWTVYVIESRAAVTDSWTVEGAGAQTSWQEPVPASGSMRLFRVTGQAESFYHAGL